MKFVVLARVGIPNPIYHNKKAYMRFTFSAPENAAKFVSELFSYGMDAYDLKIFKEA